MTYKEKEFTLKLPEEEGENLEEEKPSEEEGEIE